MEHYGAALWFGSDGVHAYLAVGVDIGVSWCGRDVSLAPSPPALVLHTPLLLRESGEGRERVSVAYRL